MRGTRGTTGSEACLLVFSVVGKSLIFPIRPFALLPKFEAGKPGETGNNPAPSTGLTGAILRPAQVDGGQSCAQRRIDGGQSCAQHRIDGGQSCAQHRIDGAGLKPCARSVFIYCCATLPSRSVRRKRMCLRVTGPLRAMKRPSSEPVSTMAPTPLFSVILERMSSPRLPSTLLAVASWAQRR